jgi:hypothetical protein
MMLFRFQYDLAESVLVKEKILIRLNKPGRHTSSYMNKPLSFWFTNTPDYLQISITALWDLIQEPR